ncbi:MAG: hypothetical protein A3G76_08055 [Acidobacteria bacterium RIFCSPLOWO2_12_FULL_65_11]|nr:MAG: hypothetical protein A3H95_05320 [Acidobacteria bacterium RIFCSPLOWO2_02_FULL_64_15]OFW28360.1 MAG: hypothetical protein A3G76_08055 [Acidobacteria bacterium RIFCSPLOWO2_12_FULL_65_11]
MRRGGSYVGLWSFALALGWIEAATVAGAHTVAAIFIVTGSYLFWTPERPRDYSRKDITILLASALVIVGAFLVEWRFVLDRQVPQQFPAWLFWTGVVLGTGWFVRVERRVVAS